MEGRVRLLADRAVRDEVVAAATGLTSNARARRLRGSFRYGLPPATTCYHLRCRRVERPRFASASIGEASFQVRTNIIPVTTRARKRESQRVWAFVPIL